jgi:hypothetical protein
MAPFLYDDLSLMLRGLMTRFIKKAVLDAAKYPSQLVKIDGDQKDVRRSYKEVDIGVAAKKAIGVSKMSDRETMEFRMQCIDFLASMTSKLIEKSPLKYSLTRAVSCLVPPTLQNCRSVSEERMQKLVEILYETQNVSATVADKTKSQFQALCDQAAGSLSSKFTSFSRSDRLDHFYYSILGTNADSAELWSVVKIVFVLSHGNATVESGFSVNGSILVENMHEESIVGQRHVYHAVQSVGGVMNVNIDKSMLQYVRGSRARYMEDLKRKREQKADEDRKTDERKRAAETIKMLKSKKAKLMAAAASESGSLDQQITELEKTIK